VTGNARVKAAAVIAASGLRAGQQVSRAELDATVQKMFDTGFFSGVNYRYDLKTTAGVTGYIVTLQVTEEALQTPVELDIPGQDPEQLWRQLKAADDLIDRQIPGNDRASAYFAHVVEGVLRKSGHPDEIMMKTEGNVYGGKAWLVCRPVHLPKVAAISFEGNSAIRADVLEKALTKVAMGEDFTERDFRRKVVLNLTPLYEELGRLTVKFTQIKMERSGNDAVAVTTVVNEGPVWNLGNVALKGDSLPEKDLLEAAHFATGAPANWKQLLLSIGDMEKVLKRNGYIQAGSNPVRSFRDTGQVVDVAVEVNKGPQFHFGTLTIEGVDNDTSQRLHGLWKLAAGAPMDEFYVREYLRSVMPSLRGIVKDSQSQLRMHENHVVDVMITFR